MSDDAEAAIQGVIDGTTRGALAKWTPAPSAGANEQDHDPAFQGAWWTHGDGPVWSGQGSDADKQAAEEIGYHQGVWRSQVNTIYAQEAGQKAPGLTSIWSTPSDGIVPSTTSAEPQGPTRYRYSFGG